MISGSITTTNINVTGSTVPANGMYLPATNSVSIATNSAQRVLVDSNGNMGVGTSSPGYFVDIYNNQNAATVLRIQNPNSGGSTQSIIQMQAGPASQYVNIVSAPTYMQHIGANGVVTAYNDFNTQIWRNNAGTERMRIDAGGNVAIGTSSPTIYGGGYTTLAVNGTTTGLIDWMGNGTRYGTAYNIGSDFFVGNATSNSLILATNNVERMRIDPNGNVAIGSGTATTKLYVQTPMLTSAANAQAFGQTIYTADGSNGQRLEITNNRSPAGGSDWTSSGFRIQQKTDATYQGYMQFNNGSSSVTNNYGISFGTGGSTLNQNGVPEVMRIDTNGNVGIGTSLPNSKLQVSGGIYNSSPAIISAATTLTSSCFNTMIELTSGPYTVTLPNPVSFNGAWFIAWSNTASTITLSTPSGAFYGPVGSNTSTYTITAAQTMMLLASDGYNWIVTRINGTGITSGTAVASTSGTSIDFTGIPSWAKRITVMFNGVSATSATPFGLVQLGSGSVTNSGYASTIVTTLSGSSVATSFTAGFGFFNFAAATDTVSGTVVLTSLGSNVWVASGTLTQVGAARGVMTAGNITLSGALDRVRITTSDGTTTFDAGSINIMYE